MQTKQKIYEVSKKLFLENGYLEVTNKQIAEGAGVTHGLIRYYFKDKKNIALTILRENYEIVASYLRQFVEDNHDPFLFFVTMDHLLNRIKQKDHKLKTFLCDVSQSNILCCENSSQYLSYSMDLVKMVNKREIEIEKAHRIFKAIVIASVQSLQYEMDHGLDLTFDEVHEKMVYLCVFALGLDWEEVKIESYINQSKLLSEKVWEHYPQLMDTKKYLYTSNLSEKSITEEILDI